MFITFRTISTYKTSYTYSHERIMSYLHIYSGAYFLPPNAERPPSHSIAHTGVGYDISDLREIYGAGTRNSACSSGGCSSGEGLRGTAVRALLATCAPSPFASKVRRKPEAFPLRGLSVPRTERVRGMASVGRAGPGEVP